MYLDASAKKQIDACVTPQRTKAAYLAGIAAAPDERSAEAFHKAFRTGRLRKGPDVSGLLPNEGLGFLARRDFFVKSLSSAFCMSAGKFEKNLQLWLGFHKALVEGRKPTEEQRIAAWAFLKSKLPTRSDGEVWLFRNPNHSTDAFDGLMDEWLPYRLGLELLPGEVRLTLGFFAKNVKAIKQPRFLDATWSYLKLWEAGGKTRPLPGTPVGIEGLEEVVAVPPILNNLASPVFEISVK